MKRNDQMPTEGCANCEKYAGETQGFLRKQLKWDGNNWLCSDCLKRAV